MSLRRSQHQGTGGTDVPHRAALIERTLHPIDGYALSIWVGRTGLHRSRSAGRRHYRAPQISAEVVRCEGTSDWPSAGSCAVIAGSPGRHGDIREAGPTPRSRQGVRSDCGRPPPSKGNDRETINQSVGPTAARGSLRGRGQHSFVRPTVADEGLPTPLLLLRPVGASRRGPPGSGRPPGRREGPCRRWPLRRGTAGRGGPPGR